MPQDNLAKLECTVCRRLTHHTYKNKKKLSVRLQLKKHCRFCRQHTLHKETK